MKPSGAPDIGDLVLAQDNSPSGNYPTPGIILKCRGIECLVWWAGPPDWNAHWWPRNRLKVINESR